MTEKEKRQSEIAERAAYRAPKFSSPDALQELVDQYFKDCEGRPLMDQFGDIVFNTKSGAPIITGTKPPTMSGLALAIGFASRSGLMRYAGKKEYADVLARAKSRVEQYMEERLFDKDGANGAKFALQNNFKGWQESAKVAAQEAANSAVKIVCDFPRPEVKSVEAAVPVASEEELLPEEDDAFVEPRGVAKGSIPDVDYDV